MHPEQNPHEREQAEQYAGSHRAAHERQPGITQAAGGQNTLYHKLVSAVRGEREHRSAANRGQGGEGAGKRWCVRGEQVEAPGGL
jgi:hypothetical protein